MPSIAPNLRSVSTAACAVALVAAVALGSGAALGKQASRKVAVLTDGRDAVSGAVDITRVSLGVAPNGRFKLNIRAAEDWDPSNLIASDGPPGSLCLKLWTTSAPPDQTPDYLVCVTSTKAEQLRASVLREQANRLPKRVAGATIHQSNRSVTLVFSQSSVGSPAAVRFAAESTRAGCARLSCVDVAPKAPKTGRLRVVGGA